MKKIILLCMSLVLVTLLSPMKNVQASLFPSLEIHFIDVGQADSILVQSSNEKTMLIDAGDKRDFTKIDKLLEKQGIKEIDILIATHPHHDHIGSMDKIITEYDVKTLIMPEIEHKTKYYKNLLKIVEEENVVIQYPNDGLKFRLGFGIKVEVLGPLKKKYKEVNDYSSVLRITHGKNKFLLMGDAGKEVEQQLIKKYPSKLKADLIKIGHHGADTGTTTNFIEKVDPRFAVISVGRGNKYGYPEEELLNRLIEKKIDIYRTDYLGTIVAKSNGKSITLTADDVG